MMILGFVVYCIKKYLQIYKSREQMMHFIRQSDEITGEVNEKVTPETLRFNLSNTMFALFITAEASEISKGSSLLSNKPKQ